MRLTRNISALCITTLMLAFSWQPAFAGCFNQDTYRSLNYGLYWFGVDNGCEKATPGSPNEYYQNDKPSVIFIHGWQPSAISTMRRSTFDAEIYGGPNIDTALTWRAKGWNIGILYWDQFADESELQDAEAKIWTANGNRAMRWLSTSGQYTPSGLTQSVTDLLVDEIVDNMSDFVGSELRIVGHSLGHQLALTVTDGLHNSFVPATLQPQRVALLDPFSSNGRKDYLGGEWIGERTRSIVDALSDNGVAIESYRTSAVASTPFIGDANDDMLSKTAYVELLPWYFGPLEIAQKHEAAIWHYFWSFEFSSPGVLWSRQTGLSASTSTLQTKRLMKSRKKFQHISGQYTPTPEDDRMILQFK